MNPILAALQGMTIPDNTEDMVVPDAIGSALPSSIGRVLSTQDIQGQTISAEEQAAEQEKTIRAERLAKLVKTLGAEPGGVGVKGWKGLSRSQRAASIMQAIADVGAGAFGVQSNSLEKTADRNRAASQNWKKGQASLAGMEAEDALANTSNLLAIGKQKYTFQLANAKDAREVVAQLMTTDSEAMFEMYGSHPGEDPNISKQKVDDLVSSLPDMSEPDKQRLMVLIAQKISEGRSKYNESLDKERKYWTVRVDEYMKSAPPGTPNPLYERINKVGKLKEGVFVPIEFNAPIDAAAQKLGVDPNMIAAMWKIESNFNPEAVGPVPAMGNERAVGIGQFLPSTAQKLGIDPMNPASAAEGTAMLIREANDAGFTSIEDIAKYYHGGPNQQNWGPQTDAHGLKVAAAYNQLNGVEGAEPDVDGISWLDQAQTKEQVSEAGRKLLSEATHLIQRNRDNPKESPESKEAKQLRMKLASLGGSIEYLNDEDKDNPYILQRLVAAHAELPSKDRKAQSDKSSLWIKNLNRFKGKDLVDYLIKNKIENPEHFESIMTDLAQSYTEKQPANAQLGTRAQPSLVGTYALEVTRRTEQWFEKNRAAIEAAFEAKNKLNVGSEIRDSVTEKDIIEKEYREGSITKEQKREKIKEVKKIPNLAQTVLAMTPEQILNAADPRILLQGLKNKTPGLDLKSVRKEIADRGKNGTMSEDDVDKYLAKLENMEPFTLKYRTKPGTKKYDPYTLKEIK